LLKCAGVIASAFFIVRHSVSIFAIASPKIPIQSVTGAEYLGQGRNSFWLGRADLTAADIQHLETINRWNPERPLEQRR
jgi:hypothetical protein